jgi:hypothetical protein
MSGYCREDRIEADFEGAGVFYKGFIENIHTDGTYDILYEDGDREFNVSIDMIRPYSRKDSDGKKDGIRDVHATNTCENGPLNVAESTSERDATEEKGLGNLQTLPSCTRAGTCDAPGKEGHDTSLAPRLSATLASSTPCTKKSTNASAERSVRVMEMVRQRTAEKEHPPTEIKTNFGTDLADIGFNLLGDDDGEGQEDHDGDVDRCNLSGKETRPESEDSAESNRELEWEKPFLAIKTDALIVETISPGTESQSSLIGRTATEELITPTNSEAVGSTPPRAPSPTNLAIEGTPDITKAPKRILNLGGGGSGGGGGGGRIALPAPSNQKEAIINRHAQAEDQVWKPGPEQEQEQEQEQVQHDPEQAIEAVISPPDHEQTASERIADVTPANESTNQIRTDKSSQRSSTNKARKRKSLFRRVFHLPGNYKQHPQAEPPEVTHSSPPPAHGRGVEPSSPSIAALPITGTGDVPALALSPGSPLCRVPLHQTTNLHRRSETMAMNLENGLKMSDYLQSVMCMSPGQVAEAIAPYLTEEEEVLARFTPSKLELPLRY